MQLTEKPIRNIVIVGGGTAGWMAAAMFSHILPASTGITLVESADIGTIGVGEATVPPFLSFLRSAAIDERVFVRATGATFKLGIRFDDWLETGHSYFHPFGEIGRAIDGHDFYQVWLKTLAGGSRSRLLDHSPAAVMAENDRFIPPQQVRESPVGAAAYALHIDAVAAARYLREIAVKRGVRRLEDTVESVQLDRRGCIERLALKSGDALCGDLFVDCTGFRGLLIEEALHSGYEDWSDYLPCDRAVVVPSEGAGAPPPYTIARALDAGWSWRIPLQHRTGNGYVYSSRFSGDEAARELLLRGVEGEPCAEPRVIPFSTGIRKRIWKGNCLALGLASGFLEPLESTAIHLIFKTLVYFIRHFPDREFDPALQGAFERNIRADYEEVRDFLVLHYCATRRTDTAFWRWCREMPIPDSLAEKVELFRAGGQLHHPEGDLFRGSSWQSVLEGMGIRARRYNPLVDALDGDLLAKSLRSGSAAIADCVRQLPTHRQFLDSLI